MKGDGWMQRSLMLMPYHVANCSESHCAMWGDKWPHYDLQLGLDPAAGGIATSSCYTAMVMDWRCCKDGSKRGRRETSRRGLPSSGSLSWRDPLEDGTLPHYSPSLVW